MSLDFIVFGVEVEFDEFLKILKIFPNPLLPNEFNILEKFSPPAFSLLVPVFLLFCVLV